MERKTKAQNASTNDTAPILPSNASETIRGSQAGRAYTLMDVAREHYVVPGDFFGSPPAGFSSDFGDRMVLPLGLALRYCADLEEKHGCYTVVVPTGPA